MTSPAHKKVNTNKPFSKCVSFAYFSYAKLQHGFFRVFTFRVHIYFSIKLAEELKSTSLLVHINVLYVHCVVLLKLSDFIFAYEKGKFSSKILLDFLVKSIQFHCIVFVFAIYNLLLQPELQIIKKNIVSKGGSCFWTS